MTIQLFKDGRIEFTTVEELLAYQKASRNGSRRTRAESSASDANEDALPETARRLVEVLFDAPDGMDTAEAAKALGMREAKGIGGFVASLTGWGRRHNLKKRQLVVKERRPDGKGHNVRRIRLGEQFRKMVKEGKVPGVKLDA
jgi:hypothetical protein